MAADTSYAASANSADQRGQTSEIIEGARAMWDQMDRGRRPAPVGRGRALPDRIDRPERMESADGDPHGPDGLDGLDARDAEASEAESAESALRRDALDALAADDAAYAALAEGASEEERAARPLTPAMRRAQVRAVVREFLRAVPRAEPEGVLLLPSTGGEPHAITRAQLTAAIDRLRPRMRQVVRLGIEERWPRQKVCAYLRGISMKTLERDQVEALDLLASL